MRERIVSDRNAEGLFDWFQYQNFLAELKQRATVRQAEIEYLDKTETHAEFCEAMKEKNECVAEPDVPLDEASYRDYRIRRAAGEGK